MKATLRYRISPIILAKTQKTGLYAVNDKAMGKQVPSYIAHKTVN